ncbi:hypothetical protein ACFL0Z_03520 [Patescibacteria group bacterium]
MPSYAVRYEGTLPKQMTVTSIIKSISASERFWIIIMIIFVLAATSLPYLFGLLSTPPDSVYLANYHRASGDHYVYMSMIEEAKDGALTFHNLFTGEEHAPLLVRPFWFTVGALARVFDLDSRMAIQIFRLVLIIPTVFVIYFTIAVFVKKKPARLIAFLFSVLASGFGYFYYRWINPDILPDIYTINFYDTPSDIWLTEGHPLLLFSASPHFQASLIFLLLSLVFFFLGFRYGKTSYLVISGLLNLGLAFFHPYETVFIFAIITVFTLLIFSWQFWKRKFLNGWQSIKKLIIPIAITAPGIIYQLLIFRLEPTLKSWSEQSQTISPEIQFYLIGYGILIPLAILGSFFAIKKLNQQKVFLLIWCWLTIPLLYIPIAFNRRFIEGLFVPLGILAAVGVYNLYSKITRGKLSKIIFVVIACLILGASLIPTNAYNLWSFVEVQRQYKVTPFYLPQTELDALLWLRDNTASGESILSSHISGFTIPAFTGRPVYLGHDLQTANFAAKKPLMEWFFATDIEDEAKIEWLSENRISYIYYGPNEQISGSFAPASKEYLQTVFANDQVQIYKFIPPSRN